MKKTSRILAVLLVAAMLASVLCIPALADGESYDRYASLKEGTGYVALGDSYTRGYGCSDHWASQNYTMDSYGNFDCRNVDGSYPNLVAEAFGLYSPDDIRDTNGKMWNLAKNAVSTAYTLDLLGIDDGFRDDEFTYDDGSLTRRYSTDLRYFGDPLSYNLEGTDVYGQTGEVMSIRQLLTDASLITINLGQADVLYKAQVLDFNTMDLSDTENLPAGIAKLIADIYEFYEYWKGAYPLLLNYIKEVNPDATVLCLGQINPIESMTLSDEIPLPLGDALTIVTGLMNNSIKQFAEEYGFIYLDLSNVETPCTENQVTITELMSMQGDEQGLCTHPSEAGYAQIARMIVAAVEETLPDEPDTPVVPSTPKTYIKVDLGRFQSVDYVVVDGKTISNYTMDGYVLTVPNYTTTAKTLAVTIKGEDGKTTVMTYFLSYDINNGYTATRVYQTNDAEGTATNIVTKITTAIKKAWNSFIGLFKK